MNTIRKVIERVDRVKPNAFSTETKLGWIAEFDGKIALDVLLMDRSELSQFNYEYPDALDKEPLVSFPHDAIYDKWLIAQIDAACEEWERYANDIEVYNSYFKNYVRWFASTYQPAQGGMERCGTYPRYFLTAYGLAVMQGFSGTLEEWLLSLHGEPGRTPVNGVDYFTEEDKLGVLAWIREQLPNQTLELDASLTKEGFAADAKKTGDAIAARALAIRKINGKPLTDDVSLTAADVGARPSNWMPSAADVGARPSNWMPSAADVGARPSDWLPTTDEIGAAPYTGVIVQKNSSVKIATAGNFFVIARLTAAAGTTGVYAVTAYSEIRAPHVVSLADGEYITVSTGGNNDTGWYVEFANTNANGSVLLAVYGGFRIV